MMDATDMTGLLKFTISNQQVLQDSIEGKISRLNIKLDRVHDNLLHEISNIRNEIQGNYTNFNDRLFIVEEAINVIHKEFEQMQQISNSPDRMKGQETQNEKQDDSEL